MRVRGERSQQRVLWGLVYGVVVVVGGGGEVCLLASTSGKLILGLVGMGEKKNNKRDLSVMCRNFEVHGMDGWDNNDINNNK